MMSFISNKPLISKNSQILGMKKSVLPLYERLFNESKQEKNINQKENSQIIQSNPKNTKILLNKFMKIFDQTLESLSLEKIDKQNFINLMLLFGFITNQADQKLNEIWFYLNPNDKNSIEKDTLFSFLTTLMGINLKEDKESIVIRKKFSYFYTNKLSKQFLDRKQELKQDFSLNISNNSKILASNYRAKQIENYIQMMNSDELDIKIPQNRPLKHTDLLVIQKETQKKLHHKLLIEKEENNLKQFKFEPDIQKNKIEKIKFRRKSIEENLYKENNKENYKENINKNEFECTFKPKINKNFKNKENIQQQNIKNWDKNIKRLRNAKKEKDFINECIEKGTHYCFQRRKSKENIRKNYENQDENNKIFENRVPLLYVDVNINNKIEKLIIYEGEKANKVAENFCKFHGN